MFKPYSIAFILSLVFSNYTGTFILAQDVGLLKPTSSGEQIYLCTDRQTYVSGESIFFSAKYIKPDAAGDFDWSKVLYVELIRWNGTKLAQAKSHILHGYSDGRLDISENIKSGNYYLRAYTMWMRNYSPYTYTYLPIKVVNPYKKSIDEGPDEVFSQYKIDIPEISTKTEGFNIKGLKEKYGKREAVDVEINCTESVFSDAFMLSVYKSCGDDLKPVNSFQFDTITEGQGESELEFFPEIDGLSISGKIINKVDGRAVPGSKVNLSSYSNSFLFLNSLTYDDGTFLFALPEMTGSFELQLSEESSDASDHQILISSGFCNQALNLPFVEFQLTQEERLQLKDVILNAQLTERYNSDNPNFDTPVDFSSAFYGEPLSTTYVKDYIELIDLREFFYELVQPVSIGNNNGEPYLTINTLSSLSLYPPLILLDNIPVANNRNLLEIPSSRIDRIEVINRGFVINNAKYSGIISIFSLNKDMAGIKTDKEQHFFNFDFFSKKDVKFPDHKQDNQFSFLPDRRNLLFWQPSIKCSSEETVKFHFYTGDSGGEYVFLLRELGNDGESVVSIRRTFIVD